MLDKNYPSFQEDCEFFKVGSPANIRLLLSETDIVNALARHLEEKDFGLFIQIMIPHISLETCNAINLKDPLHQKLVLKLYDLACLNADEDEDGDKDENKDLLFEQTIVDFLRKSAKIILLNCEDATPPSLLELETVAKKTIEKFKDDLVYFKQRNLREDDLGGLTVGLLTKETQLKAYLGLKAATTHNPATTFTDIYDAIQKHTPDIKLAGFLRSGLQPYVENYKLQFETVSLKNFHEILQSTKDNEALFRRCLLDDLFYNLLSHSEDRNLIYKFIDFFPDTFFKIMISYRIQELYALLKREEQQLVPGQSAYLNTSYHAHLCGKAIPKLTAASDPQHGAAPGQLKAAATPTPQVSLVTPKPAAALTPLVSPVPPKAAAASTLQISSARPKAAPAPAPVVSSSALQKTPLIPPPLRAVTKNITLPVQSQKSKPVPRLRRIEDESGQYQLLDADLFVAFCFLWKRALPQLGERLDKLAKEDIFNVSEIEKDLPDQARFPVRFLPPLALKNTDRTTDEEYLQKIQKQNRDTVNAIRVVSLENKGRIFFGPVNSVYNEVGLHWIYVVSYTPPLDDRTQVLILDPAFESEEIGKHNTVNYIRKLFDLPKVILVDTVIMSQQLNDADCGIACCQTALDMLEKQAITIENQMLTLHRERLTLDGERHISNPSIFRDILHTTRSYWEGVLSSNSGKAISIFDTRGSFKSGPAYNFDGAKQLSNLMLEGNRLRDELISHFISRYLPKLEGLFRSEFKFSMEDEQITVLIKQFKVEKKSSVDEYQAVVQKIQALQEVVILGELIHLDQNSIDHDLARVLKQEYDVGQKARPSENGTSPPSKIQQSALQASAPRGSSSPPKVKIQINSPMMAKGAALNNGNGIKHEHKLYVENIRLGLKMLSRDLSLILPSFSGTKYNNIETLRKRVLKWSDWFQGYTPDVCDQLQMQAFALFIARELLDCLELEKGGSQFLPEFLRYYDWSDGTLGGAIKSPLAKILGMSQATFDKYNTLENCEFAATYVVSGESAVDKNSGYNILSKLFKGAIMKIPVGTAAIKDLSLVDSRSTLTN